MEHEYQYPIVKEIPTIRLATEHDPFIDDLSPTEVEPKPLLTLIVGAVAIELSDAA